MVPSREEIYVNSRSRGFSSTAWFYLFAEFFFGIILAASVAFLKAVGTILPKPPRDLTGDVVLITGVTSSLGKSLAEEFSRVGCTIVCVDSDLDSVRKTSDELVSYYAVIGEVGHTHRKQDTSDVLLSKRACAYECDLMDRNAIKSLAKRVKNDIGRVDVLVTCVGTAGQDIFETVSTTLMSHYWTVLAFLPSMLHQEKAHIIGVTPTASTEDAYMGTRAAISGLMDSLGQEFSYNSTRINFITVAPKADPRLLKQSEEKVAKNIVQAVRRDQSYVYATWWSTSLYQASCIIHRAITSITRYLCGQGCNDHY